MSHVGDMNLEMPACGAAFDIDGIIKIARGFAVDGDDGQVAEIATAFALGMSHGTRDLMGLLQDVRREPMRQVMLPDQNFHVDAKLSGPAEQFYNAASRRDASSRESSDLDVYNRAFELRQPCPPRGKSFRFVLGDKLGGQLFAHRNHNLLMNTRFVGKDEIAALAIAEDTNHRGMSAAHDPHDAAFGARRRRGNLASPRITPLDASDHAIAVHRVA